MYIIIIINVNVNVRSPDVVIKSFVITQKLSDDYFRGCRLESLAGGRKSNEGSRTFVSIIDTSKLNVLIAAHD